MIIVITAKMELIQDANSTITRRNIISIPMPMYPLYDKCHARTTHDMTPISLMITETWILFRIQALGTTGKASFSVWGYGDHCMFNVTSRWKLWSLQKRNSFETRAQESQEKPSSTFRYQCIHCMTDVTLGQCMTWLQPHSWSLKHEYCLESKPWEPQKELHSQFGAMVTAVCSMSHQERTWHELQVHL